MIETNLQLARDITLEYFLWQKLLAGGGSALYTALTSFLARSNDRFHRFGGGVRAACEVCGLGGWLWDMVGEQGRVAGWL